MTRTPSSIGVGRPKTNRMINKNPVTVLLTRWVAESGHSNQEIAEQAGLSPSAFAMFKQGASKLPLNRVSPIAKALRRKPDELMEATLDTYHQDVKDALLDSLLITCSKPEAELLKALRAAKHETECLYQAKSVWRLAPDPLDSLKAFSAANLLHFKQKA